MSKNLHGYEQGKFIGQRCPKCKKVYVPSRGACPTDGVPTDEIVELPNTGTVTTYCVVNVPFAGQSIEIPTSAARSCWTGPTCRSWASFRRSRPTRSAWVCGSRPCGSPPEELGPTLASVKYFRPTGEPDADYETYKEYL